MKKPISDTVITPSTPEILRHLERMHYDSAEWHRDAGIKNRGLGAVEADDGFGDRAYQIDTISTPDKEKI
jgi:hypothetical protein